MAERERAPTVRRGPNGMLTRGEGSSPPAGKIARHLPAVKAGCTVRPAIWSLPLKPRIKNGHVRCPLGPLDVLA